MIKAGIPKGTRDFGPEELYKRRYIFDTIQKVFEKYGYQPIETPTMENLQTLTGKYGEEGDRLLFKVLNSGDYLNKANEEALAAKESNKLTHSIAEKGLRYDLTIPFARYVVQHQNDIAFPFKRYQIQPVWRADRPQKGRYREFYQCDVDVIGSESLLNELEMIQIYAEVFEKLGLDVTIRINNRKIWHGVSEYLIAEMERSLDNASFKEQVLFGYDFSSNVGAALTGAVAIGLAMAFDKIDKIGAEGVKNELTKGGVPDESLAKLEPFMQLQGENKLVLDKLKNLIGKTNLGAKGIEELEALLHLAGHTWQNLKVKVDPSLARGLDYYTGTIFEVTANNADMGSIGGGGRYDNLTEMFGLKGMSGVGISFGAERIYDVMEEQNLFPEELEQGTMALFINFGGDAEAAALKGVQELRANNISAELYPDVAKFAKQMKYADKKQVRYTVFLGEEEIKAHKLKVKNMESGEENLLTMEQLISLFQTQS